MADTFAAYLRGRTTTGDVRAGGWMLGRTSEDYARIREAGSAEAARALYERENGAPQPISPSTPEEIRERYPQADLGFAAEARRAAKFGERIQSERSAEPEPNPFGTTDSEELSPAELKALGKPMSAREKLAYGARALGLRLINGDRGR